jgi:NAD(P)-dependent dehydrogenase (short-subunit alcohol dehydrogenase family)
MAAKRVLITGVGRGLGRELADRLAGHGHEVWGTTRDGVTDLDIAGCVALDLEHQASIIEAAAALGEHVEALDLLVNCAGADARAFGAAEENRGPLDFDAGVFNAVLNVNVTGPMLVTRHLLPLLRQGEGPMVVNISSQLGSMQVAARKGRDTAYCVSKAALNMFSVKAAAALRPEGVGVVMLHPGWVQTDMGGTRAPMTIEESSSAIVDTIGSLSLADSGRFVRWDGHDHPW